MIASLLHKLTWLLDQIDRVARFFGSIVMFSIMVIVFFDVGFRYFLNAPLAWSFDLISVYLMAAIFFLPLADTFRRNHHIAVDLFLVRMRRVHQRWSRLLAHVLASIAFCWITLEAWRRTMEQYAAGDVLAGSIPWPTWAATALVVFGAGLLSVRLIVGTVALLLALVRGDEELIGIDESSHEGSTDSPAGERS